MKSVAVDKISSETQFMPQNAKIFVAGHRGLVGSAIVRQLEAQGYHHIIKKTHQELDLTSQQAVEAFFQKEQPEFVILAAAKVGGIHANSEYPAQFYYQNMAIQMNVIHECYRYGVKRLLFLGSSCIYPRECPQPICEAYLLSGALESTNRAYAMAKISGIEMCRSYNQEYATQYIAAMPTNLYGIGDNYHPENSHVIPGLIRRIHEAKEKSAASVAVWGTGAPKREFLFNEDLAQACVFLMNLPQASYQSILDSPAPVINIGYGSDLTIKEVVELVKNIVGYRGLIEWDHSKPDGTPRKLLDSSLISSLGWQPTVDLGKGLAIAYKDFQARMNALCLSC